ncbi:DUF4157 domain-containing protein [Spirulina sp. CCNP1310]|nr:DUF4157 domain-containing protein [Spirulina sp. CCNP1310]
MVAVEDSGLLPVQAKLTLGEGGDRYEQEADATAKKVVQAIHNPTVQTKSALAEPLGRNLNISPLAGVMQAQGNLGGGAVSADVEAGIQEAKGGGQALDAGLQESMGQAMGADFSGVRIHANAQSNQLNTAIQAKAFTTGQDVFFRQGEYNPGNSQGQELIAHELTHVVQQSGGSHALNLQKKEQGSSGKKTELSMGDNARTHSNFKASTFNQDFDAHPLEQKLITHELTTAVQKQGNPDNLAKAAQKSLSPWQSKIATPSSTLIQAARDSRPKAIATPQQHSNQITKEAAGYLNQKLVSLAKDIQKAVPNDGDAEKISREVSIPISPIGTGTAIGFTFANHVERDGYCIKMRTKVGLKLTGSLAGDLAELSAALGGYIEVQGKDGQEVVNLISYVIYRTFAQSNIPYEVEALLWGGNTSSQGRKAAYDWSRTVEKDMNNSSYAEIGAYASLSGHIGTKNLGQVYGSLEGSAGKRYSKDSIEQARKGGKDVIGYGSSLGDMVDRGARGSIGQGVQSASINLGISIADSGKKFEGKITWLWEDIMETLSQKYTKTHYVGFKYQVSGQITVPSYGWSGLVTDCIDKVADNITERLRLLCQSWSSRDNEESAKLSEKEIKKKEKEIEFSGKNITSSLSKFYKNRKDELSEDPDEDQELDQFALEVSLEGVKNKKNETEYKPWVHTFILRKIKTQAPDSSDLLGFKNEKKKERSNILWKTVIDGDQEKQVSVPIDPQEETRTEKYESAYFKAPQQVPVIGGMGSMEKTVESGYFKAPQKGVPPTAPASMEKTVESGYFKAPQQAPVVDGMGSMEKTLESGYFKAPQKGVPPTAPASMEKTLESGYLKAPQQAPVIGGMGSMEKTLESGYFKAPQKGVSPTELVSATEVVSIQKPRKYTPKQYNIPQQSTPMSESAYPQTSQKLTPVNIPVFINQTDKYSNYQGSKQPGVSKNKPVGSLPKSFKAYEAERLPNKARYQQRPLSKNERANLVYKIETLYEQLRPFLIDYHHLFKGFVTRTVALESHSQQSLQIHLEYLMDWQKHFR